MSISEENLTHVSVPGDNGSPARDYWIDEANGVAYKKDGNGKMVAMSDVRASVDGVQTRDLGAVDVHIPSALSNYAAGYSLEGGIAEVVAPVVLVDKASDYFYTFDKDDAFQPAQDLVQGEGDRVKEISPRLSSTLFKTVPYALGAFIPQGLIANADAPLNPRMTAIGRIMNAMNLAREIRTAAVFNASAFSGYTAALGVTTKWNGGTASDPVYDIQHATELALQNPTHTVFCTQTVWHDFVRNPNVARFGMYKDAGKPFDPSTVAGLLDIPTPVIGKMKGKSASAGTYSYVWGHNVILMHQTPGVPADGMTIAAAKTFRWKKGGLGMDSNGYRVRMFFDPQRGQDGGEVVVVAVNEVPVITGAPTSYLYTSVHI